MENKTDTQVIERVKIDTSIEPPSKYSVVYINDNTTTVEFVVESLITFFGYTELDSLNMAETINDKGEAIAATHQSEEYAQYLSNIVMQAARSMNYPLVVEVREE
jgi:ATP-dependent Clp protease adapter protein ClpS